MTTLCQQESVTQPEGQPGSLSRRSFHALKWNYLGNAARAVSQLLIGIVLARILGPEAFGTIAIAWLMVGAGMLVADLGFGAALVQRRELSTRDISFVFTMQVALGALLFVAGVALGGAVAAFFHRPEAGPVIRTMALLFLFQSFGQTPLAILRRTLDFKGAQAITITSYLVGYVAVGIPCAYSGCGAWSLVAAQLLQSAMSSFLALRRSGLSMRPVFTRRDRDLFLFGTKVIGANLSSWGIANVDSFVVGRMLGVVELGLYSRAMTLVASPSNAVAAGLQGVLFAAGSRAQADPAKIKRAYLAATAVVATICFPVFITVAAVSEAAVAGIYGSKWTPATSLLVPLALAMPVNAILALVGPVLTAMNRVSAEVRAQALTLLLTFPVLFVTARHSLEAVAWGVLALYVFRCFLLIRSLLALLDASWGEVLGVLVWPALCGVFTALGAWGMDRLSGEARPSLRLLADVVAAALSLAIAGRFFGRQLLEGPHRDFLLADGRVPGAMRCWLRV